MSDITREFVGLTALVTGASRGIGREIAVGLGRGGAFVGVHYAGAKVMAEETLMAIRAAGGDGVLLQADLAQPDGPGMLGNAFLDVVAATKGSRQFDILVNNAGTNGRWPIEAVDEQAFDRVMGVNFRAPFFLIKALAPALREGGRIINISSMATRAGFADMAAYAPSKAALESLTVLLAKHYGPRGITVNAVMPGATDTDMNPLRSNPNRAAEVTAKVALGRIGQPEDIASLVLFLASGAGGWVTGQRIECSGGQGL